MIGREQTGFVVLVADRTQVAANDLEVSVLANVVLGHLEHAQVEIGYWTEGAACYQDHRLLVGIAESRLKTMVWEAVVWGICERRKPSV